METIKFNHLCQNYGILESLVDITFDLEEGNIYLLAGPLKAGKSTIFKFLKGFLDKRRGGVSIGGERFKAFTQDTMAYLSENTYLMADLKVYTFLSYYKTIYLGFNRKKAEDFLKRFGIGRKRKMKRLSQSEKEIMLFVLTMCRKAELYLLDDPMSSISPEERSEIIKPVFDSLDQKACVVLATDLLCNIKPIFDEVIFIYEGHIVSVLKTNSIEENSTMEIYDNFLRRKSLGRNRA